MSRRPAPYHNVLWMFRFEPHGAFMSDADTPSGLPHGSKLGRHDALFPTAAAITTLPCPSVPDDENTGAANAEPTVDATTGPSGPYTYLAPGRSNPPPTSAITSFVIPA